MFLAPSNYVPQISPQAEARRRQAIVTWALAGILFLTIAGLTVAAPLALAGGHDTLAQTIYHSFSPFCHQNPGRSFHLRAHPLAVCARCAGLYFGLALGFAVYPLFRQLSRLDTPARGWLILALLPVSVDFLLGYLGLRENTHWSRAITGGVLGVAAVFFLVPGLLDLRRNWRNYFSSGDAGQSAETTPKSAARQPPPPSDYSAPERRIRS
jgi:uncharacterized membrane protein